MYRDDKIVMNFYLVDKCILWEKLNINLKKKIKFYTELLKWWKESNEWLSIEIYIYIHYCLVVKESSEEPRSRSQMLEQVVQFKLPAD